MQVGFQAVQTLTDDTLLMSFNALVEVEQIALCKIIVFHPTRLAAGSAHTFVFLHTRSGCAQCQAKLLLLLKSSTHGLLISYF